MEDSNAVDGILGANNCEIFGDHASKVKLFSVTLDGLVTDFVISDYVNQVFIIITQFQKIGTLIAVRNLNGCGDVCDVKIVSGLDTEENQVAARFLSSQINIFKPILFSISLKNYQFKTLKIAMKKRFGQVVVGPPGSGKTTYCHIMGKLLEELGRNVAIINMDPANESKIYEAAVDVFELITLEDVMENMGLGPNGALVYCMEFLEKNISWLENKISQFKNHYFIFDCPGQVELYTHHSSVKNILEKFEKLDLQLNVTQLVDSHYCNDAGKFIATVLMALSSMLQLGMPHINILSKFDLAEKYNDKLQFNINFYTDVLDLNYFLTSLEQDAITKKYTKLNSAIISLVEDYSLVSFLPLNVNDRSSVLKILAAADKANGYVFGVGEERNVQTLLACAAGAEYEDETLRTFCEKKEEEDDKKTRTTISDDLLWR